MPTRHPGYSSWLILTALLSPKLVNAGAVPLGISPAELNQTTNCPSTLFATRDTPSSRELTLELAKLAAVAESCDMRADFQAHRGALLLLAGQIQEAATALEKALLLNPELPGAQLDYAQALAQKGQSSEARELLRQVSGRPDIQPDLLQWLDKGLNTHRVLTDKEGIAAPPDLPFNGSWRWSGLGQTSLGKETNLFSATHTTSLTLHLTSGLVDVPLSDSERPMAGRVIKFLGAVQGLRALGEGELRMNLALQTRRSQSQSTDHSQLTEGALSYAWPVGPGLLLGGISAHNFSQGSGSTYLDHTYKIQYEPFWRFGDCKSAFSLGQTTQRYAKSPEMDGQYQHIRLEGGCQAGQASKRELSQATLWSVATGNDQAFNENRPGGNKQRTEAMVRHERMVKLPGLGQQGALSVWYRHNRSRDSQIFSSLLGTQPTQTQRHDVGIGYWFPLTSRWSVGIDVESTSQKSTNALLNIKNSSIYGGLRWASN
jgi:tetratricopeptide (TPR) repeat protein